MKTATALVASLLAGGTLLAGAATFAHLGMPRADQPTGVSLRQESQRARGVGFFPAYRSHRGGGLRGGK